MKEILNSGDKVLILCYSDAGYTNWHSNSCFRQFDTLYLKCVPYLDYPSLDQEWCKNFARTGEGLPQYQSKLYITGFMSKPKQGLYNCSNDEILSNIHDRKVISFFHSTKMNMFTLHQLFGKNYDETIISFCGNKNKAFSSIEPKDLSFNKWKKYLKEGESLEILRGLIYGVFLQHPISQFMEKIPDDIDLFYMIISLIKKDHLGFAGLSAQLCDYRRAEALYQKGWYNTKSCASLNEKVEFMLQSIFNEAAQDFIRSHVLNKTRPDPLEFIQLLETERPASPVEIHL